jgi:amino acid adenylation domain-containing protein
MSLKNISDLLGISPSQESVLRRTANHESAMDRVAQVVHQVWGHLDRSQFQEAWNIVVARHLPLRTSVHWNGLQSPVQAVWKTVETRIDYIDWRDTPQDNRSARLSEYCAAQRELGFDPKRAPLHRFSLIQFHEQEHYIVFTYDELILDPSSANAVLEELNETYMHPAEGPEPGKDNAVQFKEYLSQIQDRSKAQEAASFWGETLEGSVGPTSLDLEYGADASECCHEYWLVEPRAEDLRQLAKFHGCKLEVLLIGAWALLLGRRARTERVIFGVGLPTPGYQLKTPAGCFHQILPLQVTLPPAVRLHEWFRDIEARVNGMNEFSHYSLQVLAEWAKLPQNEPLFGTSIVINPVPESVPHDAHGSRIVSIKIHNTHSQTASIVLEAEIGADIVFRLSGNICGTRFAAHSMVQQYLRLLDNILYDYDAPLADLHVISEGERRLTEQLSGTDVHYEAKLAYSGIDQSAASRPDSVAVIFDEQRLTYAELNARANQLAQYLQALGVGAEKAVGVFLPRCLETPVVVLGILKAGGVYVPLNPEYPKERISLLVEDANITALITKDELLAELPLAAAAAQIVSIDGDLAQIQLREESAPEAEIHPDHLAYLIYTSGSTGRPKPVGVSHGVLANHIRTMAQAFGYTAEDRAMVFASLSFDVSIEQLLAPLTVGASIVLRGQESWSSREFWNMVEKAELTSINTPPAYWQQLIEDITPGAFPKLRQFIVGGDVLGPEAVRRWTEKTDGRIALLNAYGPTEAVITATLFRIPTNQEQGTNRSSVSIGSSLPGRKTYILDHWGDPVSLEAWGELHIGGELLARGYIGHPELTAERFVPDPFSKQPGQRLYRTGDIARYRTDGTIDFRGRSDQQIKVRGFRIELGEIEAALESYPTVRQGVAIAQESEHGEKRIAAFVVLRETGSGADEIREHLRAKLPDYMVPATLTILDSLPLTGNGKVDRKALTEYKADIQEIDAGAAFVSDTERDLADIWRALLALPEIGPEDDFFEAGGDSLQATSLITRMEKKFGIEVPVRTLFVGPTIRQLAAFIEKTAEAPQSTSVPKLRKANRDDVIPMSFAQERLWVLNQLRSQQSFYNVSGGIRLQGELDVEMLELTISELISRHEPLRTVFQDHEDSAIQVIKSPYPVNLKLVDLSQLDPAQAQVRFEALAWEEEEHPFDLSTGPMLRTLLFRLGEKAHVLWFTLHHIVADGPSVSILLQELCMIYEAFSEGQLVSLPQPPFQFADYACWEREWLTEEVLDSHLQYWRKQLSQCPEPALLPMEREVATTNSTGATVMRSVGGELSDKVHEFVRQKGATSFMLWLTVWKALLWFYTGQSDLVVGTHVTNRTSAETESMVGFFVNNLVLRTDLSGNPRFDEALEKVREVTVAAFQHQAVPFERLVDELRPRYRAGQTPFFKTCLSMHGSAMSIPGTSELKMTLIEPEDRSAKFDLTLFVVEDKAEVRLAFNYKTQRFTREAMEQIAGDYETLVREVIANPELRLDALTAKVAGRSSRLQTWKIEPEANFRRMTAESSK